MKAKAKLNQKHSKNAAFKMFIKKHRFLAGMSAAVGLIVLLAIATVGYHFYKQSQEYSSKEQVQLVRSELRQMVDNMRDVDSVVEWRDESYCAVRKARMFGEGTGYGCYSSYKATTIEKDKQSIHDAVKSYQPILEDNNKVILFKDVSEPYINENDPLHDGYVEVHSFGFEVRDTVTKLCEMSYKLTDEGLHYRRNLELHCNQKTHDAYFEPVKYL